MKLPLEHKLTVYRLDQLLQFIDSTALNPVQLKELSSEFLSILKANESFLSAYPVYLKYPVEFALKVGDIDMFRLNINKMLKM